MNNVLTKEYWKHYFTYSAIAIVIMAIGLGIFAMIESAPHETYTYSYAECTITPTPTATSDVAYKSWEWYKDNCNYGIEIKYGYEWRKRGDKWVKVTVRIETIKTSPNGGTGVSRTIALQ